MLAGIVEQDAAHLGGSHGHEVTAAFERVLPLLGSRVRIYNRPERSNTTRMMRTIPPIPIPP